VNYKSNKSFTLLVLLVAVSGVLLFLMMPRESYLRINTDVSDDNAAANPAINRYDAIGDSITLGEEFSFTVDVSGLPRKSFVTFHGWPGLLGNLLANESGSRIDIVIVGRRGYRAAQILEERLRAPIDRELGSNVALLLLGTNDSNDFEPTPSGNDCRGSDCDNTYKGHMQLIVQELLDKGRDTIYIGLLPPAWGSRLNVPYADPLDMSMATRNRRIVDYNDIIIRDLLKMPGIQAGPDLFGCFLSPTRNRFSLFKDTLHPNALGYVMMAALWRDAIAGKSAQPPVEDCPSPVYILESLDPYAHGHKQDLLEEGDPYYNDEHFVLTGLPNELVNGIWVTQANADNDNRDEDFLIFDAGKAPVTVYIAYDPAGSPPLSSSHEFAPFTLSSDLSVSDPAVETFRVVRATNVSGWVRIGGNQSAYSAALQQGYIVIVVP